MKKPTKHHPSARAEKPTLGKVTPLENVLVLRADASATTGLGHIGRCLALAEAWHDRGGIAILAASGPFVPLKMMAGSTRLEWLGDICPPTQTDAGQTTQLCQAIGARALVLDSYHHTLVFETHLRQTLPLLVIDDLASRKHDCDAILDTSIVDTQAALYAGKTATPVKFLLGTSYVLLRRPFRAGHFQPRGATPPQRLLVSFGGTDPLCHTDIALDVIGALPASALVADIVLSRANPRLDALAHRVSGMINTVLHIDTNEMAALMAQADLALGSGGTTSWERCRAGLPTLMTIVAENQVGIAKILAGAGIVRLIPGEDAHQVAANMAAVLPAALHDSQWRASASHAGMALVDGQGTERVIEVLLQL